MKTKAIIAGVLCAVGWAAVGYHVYQGYGFEHAVGFIGFLLAAIGHAILADVLSVKAAD